MKIADFRGGFDAPQVIALAGESGQQPRVESAVAEIVQDVRQRGDAALIEYSARFDGFKLSTSTLRVSAEEIRNHTEAASPEMVEVLRAAIRNVREFHTHQVEESWEFSPGAGIRLGVRSTPIARVGLYIPGGKAAYLSSVIMNAIPV